MTTQRDINNQIKFAQNQGYAEGQTEGLAKGRAEGRAEGHADGLAEGEIKGKQDVAKVMLANGLGIEKIAEYTGLSKEQLEILLA